MSDGIKEVITKDDPKLLIEQAKDLARKLAKDETTRTQIRKLFSTIRNIEMNWPRTIKDEKDEEQQRRAYRELLMFSARLTYQGGRDQKIKELVKVIQTGIEAVDLQKREHLERLAQFFEAVVAYTYADNDQRQPAPTSQNQRPPNRR
ncbi:MAG: type III-A CRISPR-associated protein Csm2 [Anaerolineae bacterium]|jgi:CRISPR type III-A-associated protein Csm2|nr:type III-A CRISPR-associated protein Csm2 [Anaerolineae bacterium]